MKLAFSLLVLILLQSGCAIKEVEPRVPVSETPQTSQQLSDPSESEVTAFPGGYLGKVVGVADGDTLTLLVGTKQLKIRLAEIDAPERSQPYGTKAKHLLSDLVFGRSVRIVEVDRDRYGRIVAQVYV